MDFWGVLFQVIRGSSRPGLLHLRCPVLSGFICIYLTSAKLLSRGTQSNCHIFRTDRLKDLTGRIAGRFRMNSVASTSTNSFFSSSSYLRLSVEVGGYIQGFPTAVGGVNNVTAETSSQGSSVCSAEVQELTMLGQAMRRKSNFFPGLVNCLSPLLSKEFAKDALSIVLLFKKGVAQYFLFFQVSSQF